MVFRGQPFLLVKQPGPTIATHQIVLWGRRVRQCGQLERLCDGFMAVEQGAAFPALVKTADFSTKASKSPISPSDWVQKEANLHCLMSERVCVSYGNC